MRFVLPAMMIGTVLGCGQGTSSGPRSDADTTGETAQLCCPIADAPTCDCFDLGGSVADGCHAVCDAPPVGWSRATDDNGCPVWAGGMAGSCLGQPDTIDADASEDTAPDTAPDTSTDTAPTDTAEPSDADVADSAPDGADTDGDASLPDDDVALRFALAGSIQIVEQYSDGAGEVVGTYILIDLGDRPDPMLYRLAASDETCKVWTRPSTTCTPACALDETCDADSRCSRQPTPISAGDITFDGLSVAIAGKAQPDGSYVLSPDPPPTGLFDAGAAISVSAAGAALPAFTARVTGVGDMHVQGTGLIELYDDKPATISWTPAGDGSQVEAVLQLGWHGAPPAGIIVCRAPDSAGEIVVSPAIIQRFPYFSGIGLFQVPSWIERVSRALVASPAGPLEVVASSRIVLGVTHAGP